MTVLGVGEEVVWVVGRGGGIEPCCGVGASVGGCERDYGDKGGGGESMREKKHQVKRIRRIVREAEREWRQMVVIRRASGKEPSSSILWWIDAKSYT